MKQSGFTLIEAIFSVLIAAMILTGIFSYFSDSIQKVGKSEQDLKSIKSIQKLVNDLHHDLSHLKPYAAPDSGPIDNFPTKERFYTYEVKKFSYGDSKGQLINPLKPAQVKFKRAIDTNGIKYWQKLRQLDSFFSDSFTFANVSENLENSVTTYTRQVPNPGFLASVTSAKVEASELYLYSDGEKILYRFYEAPFFFVRKYGFASDGEEIIIAEYGLDNKKNGGHIHSFDVSPVFEHIFSQPKINKQFELKFTKLYFRVNLSVKGNVKKGPEAKFYAVNFNVISPLLNGDKFHQGKFQ